jgi:hypothetical protein
MCLKLNSSSIVGWIDLTLEKLFVKKQDIKNKI